MLWQRGFILPFRRPDSVKATDKEEGGPNEPLNEWKQRLWSSPWLNLSSHLGIHKQIFVRDSLVWYNSLLMAYPGSAKNHCENIVLIEGSKPYRFYP